MASYVVYRHFDKDGNLLYVGQTQNEHNRRLQHKASSRWYEDIAKVTLAEYPTRQDAIQAEAKAIAEERPLHNGNKEAATYRNTKKFIKEAKAFHSQFWEDRVTTLEGVRKTLQKACDHLGGPRHWAWKFGYTYHFVCRLLCKGVDISPEVAKLMGYNVRHTYVMKDDVAKPGKERHGHSTPFMKFEDI